MVASYEASRFPNVRFRAVLTIIGGAGSRRVRELAGVSKILAEGEATARLMRISAPADMRGVGTLTIAHKSVADDLWVYLPSLRRVRRLVASNRRDPWMGSDFSYGDVAGHEVADWSHSILRRESLQNQRCIVVESTPIRRATSGETGYSRRLTWLRESDAFALRADFFDLSGAALKTMEASDVRLLDKSARKSQAMLITMSSARSKSTLAFDDFRIDAAVDDDEVGPGALTQ
jgi:hypothetical protein